jgi:hypothetical protein
MKDWLLDFVPPSRAKDDPEKVLLPTIVYVNSSDNLTTAHLLLLGWWDFSIGIALVINPKRK